MKYFKLTFILIVILFGCAKTQENPQIVVDVLKDYFQRINSIDVNQLNELTTPDFILFENGMVWTNDSLVNNLKKIKSFHGEWKLDQVKVNMDGSIADIVYFNEGNFVMNDTIKTTYRWIESATFRKIDGKWKMNFLHSSVRK